MALQVELQGEVPKMYGRSHPQVHMPLLVRTSYLSSSNLPEMTPFKSAAMYVKGRGTQPILIKDSWCHVDIVSLQIGDFSFFFSIIIILLSILISGMKCQIEWML